MSAWWKLSRTTIVTFVREAGCEIARGADLFDTLWQAAKHFLELDDAETLKLVHKRMITQTNNESVSSALLEMDECNDLLDWTDVYALTSQQKREEYNAAKHGDLRKRYANQSQSVFPPREGPRSRPKARANQRILPCASDST